MAAVRELRVAEDHQLISLCHDTGVTQLTAFLNRHDVALDV
jgi:hypothetical protein